MRSTNNCRPFQTDDASAVQALDQALGDYRRYEFVGVVGELAPAIDRVRRAASNELQILGVHPIRDLRVMLRHLARYGVANAEVWAVERDRGRA